MIATVVCNIVADHQPVYALAEWAATYDPILLGLAPAQVELLNADRPRLGLPTTPTPPPGTSCAARICCGS